MCALNTNYQIKNPLRRKIWRPERNITCISMIIELWIRSWHLVWSYDRNSFLYKSYGKKSPTVVCILKVSKSATRKIRESYLRKRSTRDVYASARWKQIKVGNRFFPWFWIHFLSYFFYLIYYVDTNCSLRKMCI